MRIFVGLNVYELCFSEFSQVLHVQVIPSNIPQTNGRPRFAVKYSWVKLKQHEFTHYIGKAENNVNESDSGGLFIVTRSEPLLV